MFNRNLIIVCAWVLLMMQPMLRASAQPAENVKPKVVVGVVVDQMRYDFIWRYWDDYSENGFRKLVREGYSFENVNYNFVPTFTGPGHAAIYSGATPAVSGVVANDWYDRKLNKSVNCVSDAAYNTVGAPGGAGKLSPSKMLVTTVGDELKLASNGRSRVFSFAVKGRGAILPGGHAADAVYTVDVNTGNWITSSYYMAQLPSWLETFNKKKMAHELMRNGWNLLKPASTYDESTADDVPYENSVSPGKSPVFPYKDLIGKDGSVANISETPFGNDYTTALFTELLKQEAPGTRGFTDLVAVSFSATDYIGHSYGPNSIETQDAYLRLDLNIASMIQTLDATYGRENYLLFLTSDHGAAHNPQFLRDRKIPALAMSENIIGAALKEHLLKTFGEDNLLLKLDNMNVYLNREKIAASKLELSAVKKVAAEFILAFEGVANVIDPEQVGGYSEGSITAKMMNGYYSHRSGDLIFNLLPHYIDWSSNKGVQHGAAYNYDTHVPVLWLGRDIPHGSSSESYNVTSIAPTLSNRLKIAFPSGAFDKVMQFK